jgi:hypothetical protein
MDRTPGRSLFASLHLLDRQIVDRDGLPLAKVDDLLFSDPHDHDDPDDSDGPGPLPDDTDDPGALPELTALLVGQAALAARFHPGLARTFEHLRRTVDPVPEPGPASVPVTAVTDIGPEISVNLRAEDAAVSRFERWLTQHVLAHIPGSGVPRSGEP